MKNNKAITLVSLVVTIIVIIILAGVSINLTLGENGIITKSKQAKEKTEQAKLNEEIALNELYTQMESEGGSTSYDSIAKLTEFKTAIADYIEEAGGVKPEYTSDTITFRDSIKGIVKEVTKNATATEDDISEGKTAWVNGQSIIGTRVDKASLTLLWERPSNMTSMEAQTIQMNLKSYEYLVIECIYTNNCEDQYLTTCNLIKKNTALQVITAPYIEISDSIDNYLNQVGCGTLYRVCSFDDNGLTISTGKINIHNPHDTSAVLLQRANTCLLNKIYGI